MSALADPKPRVVLATGWPALRDVVTRWLSDGYAVRVVADASSIRRDDLRGNDVIVVFPDQTESGVRKLFRAAGGHVRVALIVMEPGLGPQVRGLQWGASAVVQMGDLDRDALLHVVGEVRAGRAVVEDEAVKRWQEVMRLQDGLTDHQLGIARMMESGLPTREIAGRLNVTESTVKTHVARICRRLDVPDRESLVALLHDVGLVHRPSEQTTGAAVNGRG